MSDHVDDDKNDQTLMYSYHYQYSHDRLFPRLLPWLSPANGAFCYHGYRFSSFSSAGHVDIEKVYDA
ncbi:hypothetical protein V2J09_016279 [Rumex salicifolius]